MTIKLAGVAATQAKKTKFNSDLATRPFRSYYPPGSIFCQVGDSNTDNVGGRPDWSAGVTKEWLSAGGILEGCTDVNLGNNGSAINDWVISIAVPSVSLTDRGNANVVVNNDPDLLIISLGTNELWSAARRAGIGVEATMQANFDTLINFFLENTSADIWLRMPAPFAYPNFWGDWADADAAADSSEQLRRVHLAWQSKHPRVKLFDSHLSLFGLRIDDRDTFLDEESGLVLFDDDLHPEPIGYRRMAQAMADQFMQTRQKKTAIIATPDSVLTTAVWSIDAHLSAVENAITIDLLLNPQQTPLGQYSLSYPHVQPMNLGQQQQLMGPGRYAPNNVVPPSSILQASSGVADSLSCYCHASGRVITMSYLSVAGRITATPGICYDQCVVHGGSDNFESGDVGPVTFFVTDNKYIPPGMARNRTKDIVQLKFGGTPAAGDAVYVFTEDWYDVTLVQCGAWVAPSSGTLTFQVYYTYGAYVDVAVLPSGATVADGDLLGTFPSPPGPTNFVAGNYIYINITGNTGSARLAHFSFQGYRALY